MWVSEVFLDESGRIYMGFFNWVVVILPGGWQPVDFTVEGLMGSTFTRRLSYGGWSMGLLSVKINCQ